MRRVILLVVVLLAVASACSTSDDSNDAESDPQSDPMNAVVELGRPVERGYDRTEWDPAALAQATEVANRATATTVGCVEPGPIAIDLVIPAHEQVKLPVPDAMVQCFSVLGEEDLTFSAFRAEDAKNTYIEAKAELLCGRAMAPESDPREAKFEGVVYIDVGNVIIEPDSWPIRDQLAKELGATPSKMCADATGDREQTTTTSGAAS